MILHHVPHHTGLVVVSSPVADADLLRHGDLDVVHVVTVPDRLEDGVGETENEDVLDRLLTEVVVDAVNLALVERVMHDLVQGLGRS